MPNPSGVNNFDHFSPEPAYGQKLQQDKLQQAAQLPTAPGVTAPRRAQKRATSRQGNEPAVGGPPAAPPQVNPTLTVAQNWQAIAATPGASPLVQRIAAEAQDH